MSTNYYIVDIFKEAGYNKLMEEIKSIAIKDNLFVDGKGYPWSYIEFS